jgi:hypothetical protein
MYLVEDSGHQARPWLRCIIADSDCMASVAKFVSEVLLGFSRLGASHPRTVSSV